MSAPRIGTPSLADFNINNLLNEKQKATLQLLDPRIKEIILTRLLSSLNRQDIAQAKLTLDIVASCQPDQQKTVDRFFCALLSVTDNHFSTLEKVKALCDKNQGAKALFTCASTKKANYYSKETLDKIVGHVYSCFQGTNIPSEFPCYDEGGEAFFANKPTGNQPVQNLLKPFLDNKSSFAELRKAALAYVAGLPAAQRLPNKMYLEVFNYLQNSPRTVQLVECETKALLKVLVLATARADKPLPYAYTFEEVQELLEAALRLHESYGEEVLLLFCEGLYLQTSLRFEDVVHALKYLHTFANNPNVFNLLIQFQAGQIQLPQLIENLENQVPKVALPVEANGAIDHLMTRFSMEQFPLKRELLTKLKLQFEQVQTYCREWQAFSLSQLIEKALELKGQNEENTLKLVAIGRLALRIKVQQYCHPTQVLAVLGLLLHPRGCIAQKKTGEGKSLTATLCAFVCAMQKRSVHIITSNPDLAIRDQAKFSRFFKPFGITTSHICRKDRKPEYFAAHVLYGIATDFEFAVMEEMLQFSKLFIHKFENTVALVDEADNLAIDTALNGARLGYPAEETFDWIYYPIFNFVKSPLTKKTCTELRTFLQAYQEGRFSATVAKFSDQKLTEWLTCCKRVFDLKEDDEYIVDEEKIVIMDKDTGKKLIGSRWKGGLHEFVELNHNLEPQKETITPISLSHPTFFSLYATIYGMTGTIGGEHERTEIKSIYHMDSFDVPTHQPSKRIDLPTSIYPTDEAYLEAIVERIKRVRQEGRPVLILCKTIKDTLILETKLITAQIPAEVFNEKQQKSGDDILMHAGVPQAVTIATNNAGRGTDIILDSKSKASGGLHVLLTFYPDSLRVEQQARGRSGRQGEPGSSEMILSAQKLGLSHLPHHAILSELEKKRELSSSFSKNYHICRAQLDLFCFDLAKQFHQKHATLNHRLESPSFLENVSLALRNRMLNVKRTDFSCLHTKDRQIALDAVQLFAQNPLVDPKKWECLLQEIAKRVHRKIINEWTSLYYSACEEVIVNSNLHRFGNLITVLEHHMESTDQPALSIEEMLLRVNLAFQKEEINQALDKELKQLKKQIRALYTQAMTELDKYLAPDGSGVISYLANLLEIKLSHIVK